MLLYHCKVTQKEQDFNRVTTDDNIENKTQELTKIKCPLFYTAVAGTIDVINNTAKDKHTQTTHTQFF